MDVDPANQADHDSDLPALTIELLGMPRLLAGERHLVVPWHAGMLLGAVPAAIGAAYPALLGHVVDASGALVSGLVFNVNGRDFVRDPSLPLRAGDRLLLLGADAGG